VSNKTPRASDIIKIIEQIKPDTRSQPKRILTDRRKQFISAELQNALKKQKLSSSKTRNYHPKCDGITERANQSIINKLRLLQTTTGLTMNKKICKITKASNQTTNSATGQTPQYIWDSIRAMDNNVSKKKSYRHKKNN
jgi:transposase InsO family protein